MENKNQAPDESLPLVLYSPECGMAVVFEMKRPGNDGQGEENIGFWD